MILLFHLTSRLVQGALLSHLKQSFFQLLFFITEMRDNGRRPVRFIGISRTGLTKIMILRIARAIRTLPILIQNYGYPPTILQMQKVSVGHGRALFLDFHFSALTWR